MRKRERLVLYLTSAEARESIDISYKRCLFRTVISTVTIHSNVMITLIKFLTILEMLENV